MPSRLQLAIDHITFSREYTNRMLETIAVDDWFRQPTEGVTHIAWQVGHLAMAQYRLALERIRGTQEQDNGLISAEFIAKFGKESVPDHNPANNPSPAEIRAVFDRVHRQVLEELPTIRDEQLDMPPVKPHRLFNRKIDSLFWCGHHEMVHAGQIGLLRRLLGQKPMW